MLQRTSLTLLALALLGACGDSKNSSDTDGETTDSSTGDTETGGTETGGTETGGSGLLPEGWQTQLTRAGGCADVTMYAYNEDQTIALYFSGGPVVEKAHTDGMLLQAITLPDDAITLKLQVGEKLAGAWCNDAVSPESQPQVAAEWTATAGTLTLTVTPTSEGSDPEYPSNATLELTHVDFSPGEGADAPVHVESFSMADVGVGWLPG